MTPEALIIMGISVAVTWMGWASTKLVQIAVEVGRSDERTKDNEEKLVDHEGRIRSLELGDYSY